MVVLVTSVAGQLGHDVVNELTKQQHKVIGSDRHLLDNIGDQQFVQMDITDSGEVLRQIKIIHPDVIVHCVA